LQNERRPSDRTCELFDGLQQMRKLLSPKAAPQWAPLEIGWAQPMAVLPSCNYADFLQLDESGTYAIVTGESLAVEALGISACAEMRGMVRATLKRINSPKAMAEQLNQLLLEDPCSQPFALCGLFLTPRQKQAYGVCCISCGFGMLWRLPKGSKCAESIYLDSGDLKTANASYCECSCELSPDDQLLLFGSRKLPAGIEALLLQELTAEAEIAPQLKADSIAHKLKLLHANMPLPNFTITIIQRSRNS
jgi:hypothetical protein